MEWKILRGYIVYNVSTFIYMCVQKLSKYASSVPHILWLENNYAKY